MRYEAKYQNANGCVCYDYLNNLNDLGNTYSKALTGRIIVKSIKQ